MKEDSLIFDDERVPRRCEFCTYWERDNFERTQYGRNAGECHASPPHYTSSEVGAICLWPVTQARDWCGSWKIKTHA